ncbi:molecular chaperone DnaJ [Polaromonas sp.]|nr:molecular chaperone DnaJ [Polaromonas sp.]
MFPGAEGLAVPVADGTALRVSDRANGAHARPLSAAQKRFNKLLQSVNKLQAQIAEAKGLRDTYHLRYAKTLEPLRARQKVSMCSMARLLDERLGRKGLTPGQKRDMTAILCRLCAQLANNGDKVMKVLHDKHSPKSLDEIQNEEAEGMHAMMKAALKAEFDMDIETDDEALDPMERLQALLQAAKEQAEQEDALQAERQRAAKAHKKPSAAQIKEGQQQADAKTLLRQLYRQLASALHPDRERDPAEHRRKTALMSEANAAYGNEDLMTLLQIQQRIGLLEPDANIERPEENIAAMMTLLKQQVKALEVELYGCHDQLEAAFDLNFARPTKANLEACLAQQAEDLQDELEQMEEDLKMVQSDAGLKHWLRSEK